MTILSSALFGGRGRERRRARARDARVSQAGRLVQTQRAHRLFRERGAETERAGEALDERRRVGRREL